MQDNTNTKSNLRILAQSDGWRIICESIDKETERLQQQINDDSVESAVYEDEKIYTPRILRIKQKKMLEKLKGMPERLISEMTDSFSPEDVLKDFLS